MESRKKKLANFDDVSVQYSLSYREVVEILKLLKDVDYCQSMELAIGDMKVKFSRGNGLAREMRGMAVEGTAGSAPVTAEKVSPQPSRVALHAAASGYVITAPMLGTFYRASEPGAKPYIEVGSIVEKGATVGLIEVMKLFSPVSSEIEGKVVEILVENGSLVEYGQALIRLEPIAG